MDLESVKIERYKSIHDSTWVEIDDITALVGPNEAGKTAFLEALTKLNPVKSSDTYDITQEFPRSFPAQERHKQEDDPDPVVSVRLNITESDIERIDLPDANQMISSDHLILKKDYGGNYIWEFDVDENQLVHSLLDKYRTHPQVEETLRESTTIQELSEALSETDSETEEIDALRDEVSTIHRQDVQNHIASNYFEDLVPQFLYFDDYYIMTDSVVLDDLIQKDGSEIKKEEETFISFINRAGYTLEEIREIDDFEELISDLEHVANELTSQFSPIGHSQVISRSEFGIKPSSITIERKCGYKSVSTISGTRILYHSVRGREVSNGSFRSSPSFRKLTTLMKPT